MLDIGARLGSEKLDIAVLFALDVLLVAGSTAMRSEYINKKDNVCYLQNRGQRQRYISSTILQTNTDKLFAACSVRADQAAILC